MSGFDLVVAVAVPVGGDPGASPPTVRSGRRPTAGLDGAQPDLLRGQGVLPRIRSAAFSTNVRWRSSEHHMLSSETAGGPARLDIGVWPKRVLGDRGARATSCHRAAIDSPCNRRRRAHRRRQRSTSKGRAPASAESRSGSGCVAANPPAQLRARRSDPGLRTPRRTTPVLRRTLPHSAFRRVPADAASARRKTVHHHTYHLTGRRMPPGSPWAVSKRRSTRPHRRPGRRIRDGLQTAAAVYAVCRAVARSCRGLSPYFALNARLNPLRSLNPASNASVEMGR